MFLYLFASVSLEIFLYSSGVVGREHRSVGLVSFGSDMGEPALEVIAIDGACGRDDASPRVLIGDVFCDCRALADHLPVVELEQRNLALWVDLP